MWKGVMEPYFSEGIENSISLARNGDFISTYNLLAYFCTCVQRGDFPPLILSSYVAEILKKTISEKKRKILYRHKDIHDQMNLKVSLYPHSSLLFRSIEVGNKKACSPSRAAFLEKHPPNTCVIDFCDAVRKNELNETILKNIFPVIQKIIKKILNAEGVGKAQRYELKLQGFGEWNSSEQFHVEILQDIEKHGLRKTAKNHDMKIDTIKKIRKRKKTKGGQ